VPAAVVLTQPFAASARAMAAVQGSPGFPFALMPHPINVQPEATLQTWAEAAADQVAGLLLGQQVP